MLETDKDYASDLSPHESTHHRFKAKMNVAFKDERIQRAVHVRRDRFISQLRKRETEILRLAASLCGNGPCSFFKHHTFGECFVRGSYNLSFFVQFSNGKKCVFRIPLRPCLAYSAHEKLRSEVITMQYLAQLGTIPVPKVLAYRVDEGTDPLSTFSILEFIHGKMLTPGKVEGLLPHERENLYTSLADIYLHLRRQEFSAIGRLDGNARNPFVGQKMASICMNMEQIEGLDSFGIRDSFHDERGVLQSATRYTKMLTCISYNAFLKCSNAVTKGVGFEVCYNFHLFLKQAQAWLDPGRDQGPFVLVHGDLQLPNLVFDDEYRIISVIDWEWSGVVPLQYFTPPLWLTGDDTVELAGRSCWRHLVENAYHDFFEIVKTREMDMFGNLQLYSEWSQSVNNAEPLIANALGSWSEVDWFVHRYIQDEKQVDEEEKAVLTKEFPSLAVLACIKEYDEDRYEKSLEDLASPESIETKDAASCTLMDRIRNAHLPASTLANVVGWSVGVCIVTAIIWRGRHISRP